MKRLAQITGFIVGLLASAALAQTTTRPNVSNLLSQCSANVPFVGNGAAASPICHASGALGSAAFANTGTGGATIGLLNAANTWAGTQTFGSAVLAATAPSFTGTITGTYTLGGTPTVPTSGLSGTLAAAQEPAHTGDMTNTAGSLATTVTKTNGVAFTAAATSAAGQLPGTATNDNASSGNVGQYVESVIPQGSAVALTNNTAANITSISLTAGDWDVNAVPVFSPAATTSQTYVAASISLTSATLDTSNGRFVQVPTAAFVANSVTTNQGIPPVRFSLSGTTTVFLVMQAGFTVSTASGFGLLRARRVR